MHNSRQCASKVGELVYHLQSLTFHCDGRLLVTTVVAIKYLTCRVKISVDNILKYFLILEKKVLAFCKFMKYTYQIWSLDF